MINALIGFAEENRHFSYIWFFCWFWCWFTSHLSPVEPLRVPYICSPTYILCFMFVTFSKQATNEPLVTSSHCLAMVQWKEIIQEPILRLLNIQLPTYGASVLVGKIERFSKVDFLFSKHTRLLVVS
jgi:hypothetical protein